MKKTILDKNSDSANSYLCLSRQELEAREREILAPWAMLSEESRGRFHPEGEHECRAAYQRDKDRIIHSTAFRRLEYKTQVFVNYEGDYYRTRLTHTLEVAQIARTIARIMRLNEDLVESLALAHDLGHTPFGHAGEDTLNELLKEHGGFEHNQQGLRVVDILEDRYPDFPGLNLTYEVREGLLKNRHPHITLMPDEKPNNEAPLLEAQLVDLSDLIAYNTHDLDDGLKAGVLELEAVKKTGLGAEFFEYLDELDHQVPPSKVRSMMTKYLINLLVIDLIRESARRLEEAEIKDLAGVRSSKVPLVGFSPATADLMKELEEFLWDNLYRHPRVYRVTCKARRVVRDLFKLYCEQPELLPLEMQERIKKEAVWRIVADYLAGMTDRYAYEDYRNLFIPHFTF